MANKTRKTAAKSTPRTTKKAATAKKIKRELPKLSSQGVAVIVFAVALLLLFAAIVPSETAALWNGLHNILLGTFGVFAYIIPLIMGYATVMTAQEKPASTIAKRMWMSSGVVLLTATLLEVIAVSTDVSYGQAIGDAFYRGKLLFQGGGLNSGVLGALLGYPLEYFCGDFGAKLIVALLLFVAVMLITGASLLTLWKPVEKTAEITKEQIRRTRERFEAEQDAAEISAVSRRPQKVRKPRSRIDIELDDTPVATSQETTTSFDDIAAEFADAVEQPQLRIDDIIGRAIDNQVANTPADAQAEEVVKMTKEELHQEEAAVAQQIEEQEAVFESYTYPSLSLLQRPKAVDDRTAREEMQMNAELLVQTLKEFGISTKVVDISRGPSVTRYELQPNAGVKISRITGLADDIALRLATTGVRIEAPIPNKAAIGIEVPNKARGAVCLRELIDSDEFSAQDGRLVVALGRDISGQIVTADLASMPHLLIAGTTGSGKSVCTNSMIQSVLFRSSPEEVRMILIDPKQVEFSMYNGIPHLLVPVVTNPRKAAGALGWAVTEMINRYNTFKDNNVRDIKAYNKLAKTSDTLQTMPLILIVIDELSDLMMAAGKEVEDAIVRLAQMARAAGMHLVIATQRPSVDVITGLIKANIPSRLALTVASAVDSRTILDAGGAEKLLGKGDMLFHPVGLPKPIRVQGCFVSDDEVSAVVEFLKTSSTSQYDENVVNEINRQAEANERAESKEDGGAEGDGDPMLAQAIEVVVDAGQASTSLLQRRLRVGYARAGRLVDDMEQRGIVGPHEGAKPRKVLITRQQWLEMQNNAPDNSGGN